MSTNILSVLCNYEYNHGHFSQLLDFLETKQLFGEVKKHHPR